MKFVKPLIEPMVVITVAWVLAFVLAAFVLGVFGSEHPIAYVGDPNQLRSEDAPWSALVATIFAILIFAAYCIFRLIERIWQTGDESEYSPSQD